MKREQIYLEGDEKIIKEIKEELKRYEEEKFGETNQKVVAPEVKFN